MPKSLFCVCFLPCSPCPSFFPVTQDPTCRFHPRKKNISVAGAHLQACWTWDVIGATREGFCILRGGQHRYSDQCGVQGVA